MTGCQALYPMAVRTVFSNEEKLFYVTFTNNDWIPLIKLTNSLKEQILHGWNFRIHCIAAEVTYTFLLQYDLVCKKVTGTGI